MFNLCPACGKAKSKLANQFSYSYLPKLARECRACNTVWVPGIRVWEAVSAVLFSLLLFGVGMVPLLQAIGIGRFDDIMVTVIAFALGFFMVLLYVPAFVDSRRRQAYIINSACDERNDLSKQYKEI